MKSGHENETADAGQYTVQEQVNIVVHKWEDGDVRTNDVNQVQVNLSTGSALNMRPMDNPIHVHVHNNCYGPSLHLDPEVTAKIIEKDLSTLLSVLSQTRWTTEPEPPEPRIRGRIRRFSSLPDLAEGLGVWAVAPKGVVADGFRRKTTRFPEAKTNLSAGQTIIEVTKYQKNPTKRSCPDVTGPSLKGTNRGSVMKVFCGDYLGLGRFIITILAIAFTVILLYLLTTKLAMGEKPLLKFDSSSGYTTT
eukprot:TCALIF_02889-PA protein Name:"Protein of unknown function" AED:0.21 eAED:0.21 QI:0/1/0.5/1/1/0.5/2/55/248